MRVFAYRSFQSFYRKLPRQVQRKVDKQIRLLERDPRHPSLKTKKIQGTGGIWEARVDRRYRLSFELSGDAIHLRVVGDHDDVLKNP